MRLIDADALRREIFFNDYSPLKINDNSNALGNEILRIIDNAPTIETSYDLYREETCDRKAHCYDYKYWHCIGCHGCKADMRKEANND